MEDPGLFSGFVLFLLLAAIGLAGLSATSTRGETGYVRTLFLWAFAARFLMAILLYQFGAVELLQDEDASGWLVGKAHYSHWLRQGLDYGDLPAAFAESYQHHHKGYYYLLGVLFFITGSPTRLAAAAFNCFVGAVTAVLIYRTAKLLFPERVARRVGWWVCFYPSLIVWSAQTLKEPVVILLECLAIHGCVALQRRGLALKHLVTILAVIVLLIPFRFYAAYLVSATVVLSFVFGRMGSGRPSASLVLASLGIAVGVLILSTALLGRETGRELTEHYNLEFIEKYRDSLAATTGSGVKLDYDLRTPGGMTASLLVGGLHLMFAPFPWQLASGSLRMLLAAPEVILWWWVFFVGIVPGLGYALRWRFREVLPLLVLVAGMALLYSLMFGNVGLIYRQRAQLLPWLLIFAVVGMEWRAARARIQARGSKWTARTRASALPPRLQGPPIGVRGTGSIARSS